MFMKVCLFTKFPYDLSQYMEHFFSNNEIELESDDDAYEAASRE